MKNKIFTSFLLSGVLVFASNIFAARESNPAKCNTNPFSDSDKRDFADKTPFKFDVDGDDKADRIIPRTFATKAKMNMKGVKENHWITFDIKTSQGKTIKSFFKYKYGTNLSDYWVYALVPCKINGDNKNDLLFYTGDDTSDETVILENRGNSFKVSSRKAKKY